MVYRPGNRDCESGSKRNPGPDELFFYDDVLHCALPDKRRNLRWVYEKIQRGRVKNLGSRRLYVCVNCKEESGLQSVTCPKGMASPKVVATAPCEKIQRDRVRNLGSGRLYVCVECQFRVLGSPI